MTYNRPKFFYGYVVVGASLCATVIYGGTFYTFGVFFKPVLTEFSWTRTMVSAAYSINAILWGLTDVGAGKLTDSFGPRRVITACGFFLGLGYLLMSQVSAIWQLYLFYGVIVAIGMGASFVPLMSTVARWFVKRRGLMTGIVASGIGLGTMFIPPIATRLIATYGWSTSYIVVGALALVFIISAAQFLRRDPSHLGQLPYGVDKIEGKSLEVNAKGFSLHEAVHTRQFWVLCLLFFSFLFCVNTIMVHIAAHATDLEFSETAAANILAIIGGVSVVGRLAIGAFTDRVGTRLALITALTSLTIALFWLQLTKELWMLYLFAVIFGFGYGGMVTLTSPLVADLFGLSSHGVILGIAFFAGSIGQATGPLLAGMIFDANQSYQLAFLICGVISIISIILALLLRPIASKGGGK